MTNLTKNGGNFDISSSGTYIVVYYTTNPITSLTDFKINTAVTPSSTLYELTVNSISNSGSTCTSLCNNTNMSPDPTNPANCICTQLNYAYNPTTQTCLQEVCKNGIRTISE